MCECGVYLKAAGHGIRDRSPDRGSELDMVPLFWYRWCWNLFGASSRSGGVGSGLYHARGISSYSSDMWSESKP